MTALQLQTVEIFTDGACRGNPGVGGWGALLRYDGHEKELYGGERMTTNNRMELTAAIQAFVALKHPCHVVLTTDSEYLRNGMTKWIHTWKQSGWKNGRKQPIKNQDLWERLDQEVIRHRVEWRWVRGHNGHPENERADELANKGIEELLP